jgi:AAA15 family ATPase/GTPase/DNA-directed RNA polymerase subunit F
MIIKNIYVRFYKSFNFDYLRKFNSAAKPDPWDLVDDLFYPYVRIPIDKEVTAVVGANESGKSHLLSAIHKGLSGEDIQVEDMCRYSQFQTVETGKRKVPYFGFEFDALSEDEKSVIATFFSISSEKITSFHLFRNQGEVDLYLPSEKKGERPTIRLDFSQRAAMDKILPTYFEIKSDIALPSRVPILNLISEENAERGDLSGSRAVRAAANSFISTLFNTKSYFETAQAVQAHSDHIFNMVSPLNQEYASDLRREGGDERRKAEIRLARDLICKIAKVDPESLQELYDSIREGKDGHAAGLIAKINSRLDAALNFPNWWAQDKQFRLIVSPREVDLAFTILDRTGTEYSFSERSQGLKYFLSYYVQYLSHRPAAGVSEVLTMDEPDAFLSSQAQQDLLKIFEAFANPKQSENAPIQVVYVTHSPFLIDKNHAERIRVLEKGASEEGTRVVRDAGKNHYEPLRSAFGAFVGETVFIGSTNLFLEGISDQIIMAGMAKLNRRLKMEPDEFLDLNTITLVPAGGASHIPYMAYLARGRDSEKPPVIVLLDGDQAGADAKKALGKGGARGKQILPDDYILQLAESGIDVSKLPTGSLTDIEDLIPLAVCTEVSRRYLTHFCNMSAEDLASLTDELIESKIVEGKCLFDAIEKAIFTLKGKPHIEKVGFARTLVDYLSELSAVDIVNNKIPDIQSFSKNMGVLFQKLNTMRRSAEREANEEKIAGKFKRLKDGFLRDFPEAASRQMAFNLFEEMASSLDDSAESDVVRIAMNRVVNDFSVKTERHEAITNYREFRNRLEQISYAVKNQDQLDSV